MKPKLNLMGHDDSNRFGRVGTWTQLRREGATASVPGDEWSRNMVRGSLLYERAASESNGGSLGTRWPKTHDNCVSFMNEILNNPNSPLKFAIFTYLTWKEWIKLLIWSETCLGYGRMTSEKSIFTSNIRQIIHHIPCITIF